MHYIYPNGDEVYIVEQVFICDQFKGILNIDKSEITEQKFFSLNNLPDNLSPMNSDTILLLKKSLSENKK